MDYQHLTTFERGRIEALHNSGYTVREIGQQMNRHHSTIARELSRNNNINYSVLIADAFMPYAEHSFLSSEKEKRADILDDSELLQLRDRIVGLIGEKLLNRLDQAIRDRLILAPIAAMFMQGLADDLLDCLIYQDEKTGRYAFQLLMDELSKEL